jgi:hypothetical protein
LHIALYNFGSTGIIVYFKVIVFDRLKGIGIFGACAAPTY